MSWPEDRRECEWVVCKLCTPPISIIGLKPLRLVGIVPGTELPAGTVPARGIDRAEAVLSAPGTVRAEVPAGTDLAAGTGRVRGTDPVAGIGRPWAGRGIGPAGIGRLGAGPSCGCS